MIECFENLIGIKPSCGSDPDPASNLYLQDLTFINLKLADSIISDQVSGMQVLRDCISNATNYLINDTKTRLMPQFRQASVIENNVAGYFRDNMQTSDATSGYLKGIQLRVIEYPYLKVDVSQVSLQINYIGSVDILVYDLIQNKLLDTIPVTCVPGEITTLNVNKSYKTNGQMLNLFFGYDASTIQGYKSYVFNMGTIGCRTCPSSSYGNKYVWVSSQTIAVSGSKLFQNLRSANDTGGLSIQYSLNCSEDGFICSIRQRLAFALLHRAGMEILREVQMSTRLNALVVMKKEEIADLMLWFEGEYGKAMDNTLKNLKLPNDICFVCNSRIRTGISMP